MDRLLESDFAVMQEKHLQRIPDYFVFALGAYELPLLLGATVPKALPILAYQQYVHPDLRNRPYAMAVNGMIILISLISALVYFHLMLKKEGERS